MWQRLKGLQNSSKEDVSLSPSNTSTCLRSYLFCDCFFFFHNHLGWFFSPLGRLWLGHFNHKQRGNWSFVKYQQNKHNKAKQSRCRYEFFKNYCLDTLLCFFLWSNFLFQLFVFVSYFRPFGSFLNFNSSLGFALFKYKIYKKFNRKLSTNPTLLEILDLRAWHKKEAKFILVFSLNDHLIRFCSFYMVLNCLQSLG